MPYHQMEDHDAREFRRNNSGYSVYDCDLMNWVLRRRDGDSLSSAHVCSYLVNSRELFLDFQELCRRNDRYDVIYISSSGGGMGPSSSVSADDAG